MTEYTWTTGRRLWLISLACRDSRRVPRPRRGNGAFSAVGWGALDEWWPPALGSRATVRPVTQGSVRGVRAAQTFHDVRNTAKDSVAVSLHAYSRPLSR